MALIASVIDHIARIRVRGLLAGAQRYAAEPTHAATKEEEELTRFGHLRVGLSVAGFIAAATMPVSVAASSLMPAGIGISPVFQNLNLDLNQSQAKYEVTLSNASSVMQSFKLSTVDFGSLNESGGVAFLGISSSSFAQNYGLTPWMMLDQSSVTIPSKASVQIGVTINNSQEMRPGGHYAAVLATAQTAPDGPPATSRVGVLEVLSSLVLLVKAGGPSPNLILNSQFVGGRGLVLPSQIQERFQNTGGVHVVPRGVVQVRDPLGRLVERGALNVDSGIILPQTFRRYDTPLIRLASAWMPGTYTAVTTYRYDGTTVTKSYTSHFWYFSALHLWIIITFILAVLALAIYLWRRKVKVGRIFG